MFQNWYKYDHFSWECKGNIEWYNCHKYVNFYWKCKSNVEEKVNFVDKKDEDEEPTLLIAHNSEKKDDKNLWYCSNSSTAMKSYRQVYRVVQVIIKW